MREQTGGEEMSGCPSQENPCTCPQFKPALHIRNSWKPPRGLPSLEGFVKSQQLEELSLKDSVFILRGTSIAVKSFATNSKYI